MTPHRLAKEAAEKISRNHVASLRIREANATIIHTTAVQPVIEAGDELEKALERMECTCISEICHRCEAILNWRDLKAGSKADL